jgi:hypothetical protein
MPCVLALVFQLVVRVVCCSPLAFSFGGGNGMPPFLFGAARPSLRAGALSLCVSGRCLWSVGLLLWTRLFSCSYSPQTYLGSPGFHFVHPWGPFWYSLAHQKMNCQFKYEVEIEQERITTIEQSEMWNLRPETWNLTSETWNLTYEIQNIKSEFWKPNSEVFEILNLQSEVNLKIEIPTNGRLNS